MNDTQTLTHVVKELIQQKSIYESSCSRGFPKDFAEYKYLCGTIQGLGFAIEFITDLVQKMEHSDD